MIIWGWRTVTSTVGNGTFDCPNCGPGRKYMCKRPRRFFTLYFIPVIPLQVYDEYIECQFCTKAWQPSILEYKAPPSRDEIEQIYRYKLAQLLGCAAATGDAPSAPRRAIALRELKSVFGDDFDGANLQNSNTAAPLAQLAGELAPLLDDSGKEGVFNCAAQVLASGEAPSAAAREAMTQIGAGLGLSPAHQAGLVAALRPVTPPPATAAG
jgi:hypothetical protein